MFFGYDSLPKILGLYQSSCHIFLSSIMKSWSSLNITILNFIVNSHYVCTYAYTHVCVCAHGPHSVCMESEHSFQELVPSFHCGPQALNSGYQACTPSTCTCCALQQRLPADSCISFQRWWTTIMTKVCASHSMEESEQLKYIGWEAAQSNMKSGGSSCESRSRHSAWPPGTQTPNVLSQYPRHAAFRTHVAYGSTVLAGPDHNSHGLVHGRIIMKNVCNVVHIWLLLVINPEAARTCASPLVLALGGLRCEDHDF